MNKRTVLIVEDEDFLKTALKVKLTSEGYESLTAADGKEGLQIALAQHPDIILLDIIMPIMDGMSMINKLREDPWGASVPVIFLTNKSPDDEKQINNILNSHPAYYLIKSNSPLEDVIVKIKEVLND